LGIKLAVPKQSLGHKCVPKQSLGTRLKGIIVRGAGRATIAEEISEAYKDVESVVDVTHGAGISRKVAKLKPLGVIKG
jgi:tRNA-splicing ligase RtcB (3'-phosphate/5'-hydroxy nucleic acid ligase)